MVFILEVFIMKVNLNTTQNYNQSFTMHLVQDASLTKYIDSLHISKQQDNLKQAIQIIKKNIEKIPQNNTLTIGALHPSKANFVKTGTYNEFYVNLKGKTTKKTSNILKRENIFLKLDGHDKIQGFYMNPDENPKTLANWFMNTYKHLKNSFLEKS